MDAIAGMIILLTFALAGWGIILLVLKRRKFKQIMKRESVTNNLPDQFSFQVNTSMEEFARWYNKYVNSLGNNGDLKHFVEYESYPLPTYYKNRKISHGMKLHIPGGAVEAWKVVASPVSNTEIHVVTYSVDERFERYFQIFAKELRSHWSFNIKRDFNTITDHGHSRNQMGQSQPTQITKSSLLEIISKGFDDSELRTLTTIYMQIDYDSLRGEGKKGKARELISYCERTQRYDDLVSEVHRQRPHVFID